MLILDHALHQGQYKGRRVGFNSLPNNKNIHTYVERFCGEFLSMLRSIPVRVAVTSALVSGAFLASLTYMTYRQTEATGAHLANAQLEMAAGGLQMALKSRVEGEMAKNGLLGTPSNDLMARQTRLMIGTYPAQVSLFSTPAHGKPLATSLDDAQQDAMVSDGLDEKLEPFTMVLAGRTYVSRVQPISFTNSSRPDYLLLVQVDRDHIYAGLESITHMALVHFVAGVAAALLLGWLLGRMLAARLEAITVNMEQAERGEKPGPVAEKGTTEIKRLAHAANVLIQGPSAKDKVRQQANTDALTGLANRRALVAAMDDLLKNGRADVCLMFLDLDGFKPINDTYGHEVGDEVLIEVAKRLDTCVREQDLICRLGGDEFVLMFRGLTEKVAIEERAKKVLERINEPYWVGDKRVTMGVSIGIAIGPQDGKDGETLLNASDEAMYSAKKTGKNQFTYYS